MPWHDITLFRKIIDNLLFHGLKIFVKLDPRKRDIAELDVNKINKILFIATAGIGDTLFASPAIRGLRERFPNAQIWLLLNETYFDFFKSNPNVDKAFCVPSNGYRDFLRSIKLIRKERFDVAIVSHAHDYSGTTRPYLAGIKFIIGGMWFRTKFGFLLSNSHEHQKYDRSLYKLLEYQVHLVNLLDCRPKSTEMEVYLSNEDFANTDKILGNLGITSEDQCIGFQVKTQSFCKDWPTQNYITLGKGLLKYNPRFKIVLLGAPSDQETADYVLKGIGHQNVFNLAGKTTLGESAACVRRLKLLICGVTGMLHISTALNTKTIALLGGLEYPDKLGTLTSKNKDIIKVIKKPKTCEICSMRVCTPPAKCMELITVDEVLEAAKWSMYS